LGGFRTPRQFKLTYTLAHLARFFPSFLATAVARRGNA
jgi:hypothetical protein